MKKNENKIKNKRWKVKKSKKISEVNKNIQLLKACFVQKTSEIVQREKKQKSTFFFWN